MNSMRPIFVFAFVSCYAACATYSDSTCTPGDTQSCTCPDGVGLKTCKQDGSGWTDCYCPCAPDCSGRECGPDPECGESCGECFNDCDQVYDPSLCHEGQCAVVCCPNCDGKKCGPDGCGGICPPGCAAGQVCLEGECCTPDCRGRQCGPDPVCGSICGYCEPGEYCAPDGWCEGDVCPDPERPYLCPQDNTCHECCVNDDCLADEACNADFECEALCCEENEDCSRDVGCCCAGLCCDVFTSLCIPQCMTDSECTATHSQLPYAGDLQCTSGCCDFLHCNEDAQCPPGMVCFNGDCITRPDCADITHCQVTPPNAVTQTGSQVEFVAAAYLSGGALAPDTNFDWVSSDSSIAAVSDGVVTGGAVSGEATITANVSGCETECMAYVVNHGAVASGTRVVVVDELAGTPIAGATVEVGGQAPQTTDAAGVATVSEELSPGNPQDVSVYKTDYAYATLRQVESSDVIVHLRKLYDWDFRVDPASPTAGGIRGSFDLSMIQCEAGHTCDVPVGFAGLSMPGNLVNLRLDRLAGPFRRTLISIPGLEMEEMFPVGFTACLGMQCFAEYYTPVGVPGVRVAWGLGAKLDLSEVIAIVGPMISGGEIDYGQFLVQLLGILSNTHTAVEPGVEVVSIPQVLDVNDLDNNPATTHVPDYDNFTTRNMTPKLPMLLELEVNLPAFPARNDGWHYDGVVLLAGVMVQGAGFVPLGVSAGLDAQGEDEVPDGQVDSPISIAVSPVAGRIPEEHLERVLIALALNLDDMTAGVPRQLAVAGQVIPLGSSFNTVASLDAWMAPPVMSYDNAARRLTVSAIPASADYCQATFNTGRGTVSWDVLGEWTTGGYDLPAAPASGDRADTATFAAIDLQSGLSFQDLPEFNATNMNDLPLLVRQFVLIGEQGAPVGNLDCGSCSTSAAGGFLGLWLLFVAIHLVRRRRS